MATGVFFAGTIGMAQAIPLVNVANDGYEDISGATYANYANSGTLMDVYVGNNEGHNLGVVEGQIEDWLVANTSLDSANLTLVDTTDGITFTNYDSSATSGEWNAITDGDVFNFYIVKAWHDYATYLVTPAEGTGSWSTYDLQLERGHGAELEISHFTAYNSTGLDLDELFNSTPNPGAAPVPEPSTILLVGAGLVGIVSIRKGKKKE